MTRNIILSAAPLSHDGAVDEFAIREEDVTQWFYKTYVSGSESSVCFIVGPENIEFVLIEMTPTNDLNKGWSPFLNLVYMDWSITFTSSKNATTVLGNSIQFLIWRQVCRGCYLPKRETLL